MRSPAFALPSLSRCDLKDALAAKYPENPLLQFRGNAGTHDLSLGMGTIRALKGACQSVSPNTSDDPARKEGMIVRVPRYDKSAGGGRGDRAPAEDWVEVAVPLDIVLLEGWMLGFEALAEDSEVLAKADGSEFSRRQTGLHMVAFVLSWIATTNAVGRATQIVQFFFLEKHGSNVWSISLSFRQYLILLMLSAVMMLPNSSCPG